jgi:hypothetical protein
MCAPAPLAIVIAELAITMAPAMEKEGIVAPGEIDPATFPRRMSEEVERLASVVIGRSENWRLVAQAVTVSRPDQEVSLPGSVLLSRPAGQRV